MQWVREYPPLRPAWPDQPLLQFDTAYRPVALGNIALHHALNPYTYNLQSDRTRGGPVLFVLDNVDPDLLKSVVEFVTPRLKKTSRSCSPRR